MIKRVSVRTDDNVKLKGFLFTCNKQSDILNIFIPGFEGNIVSNDFIDSVIEKSVNSNMDFLYVHTRGSFQISNSPKFCENDHNKLIGIAFETIEDSIYDLDSWFCYAFSLNYKKINIICHSFSSIKFINYLNEKTNNFHFNNIIFLSPMDYIGRTKMRKNYNLLMEQAVKNISIGNSEQLIKCGFYYQSSDVFVTMMNNRKVNCWPILNPNEINISRLNIIKNKVTVIYGEKENTFVNNIPKFQKYCPNNYIFKILERANHNYENREEELSKMIMNILENE